MSSVAAILFSPDRRAVYLLKRRDIPVWVFPGGGIEEGETPEQAVLREVKEEMGFTASIMRKVAFYEKGGLFTKPTHFFECTIVKQGPPHPEETLEVRPFLLTALPPMIPLYHEWLQDALANHPHPLHKKIQSITFWAILKAFFTHPILFMRFILTRLGIHLNT